MVFFEVIYVMLMMYDKFCQFMLKLIVDVKILNQVLFCLFVDSCNEVDEIVGKVGVVGGVVDFGFKDEYSFMYGCSFEDLDGYMWGVNWLDMVVVLLWFVMVIV